MMPTLVEWRRKLLSKVLQNASGYVIGNGVIFQLTVPHPLPDPCIVGLEQGVPDLGWPGTVSVMCCRFMS